MDSSLSIVLPVHNAQSRLAEQVTLLLEVLPELTSRFEILIVDDASTDETDELAAELASRYPQVQVARHSQRGGAAAAVKTGLDRTSGEIVFVQDEQAPLSQRDLCELWKWRGDMELVAAQAKMHPSSLDPSLIDRLPASGRAARQTAPPPGSGGIQMIRRSAVDQVLRGDVPENELVIERITRTDKMNSDVCAIRRPSILSKIIDFAVGQ